MDNISSGRVYMDEDIDMVLYASGKKYITLPANYTYTQINEDAVLDADCLSVIIDYINQKDLARYLSVSKWFYKKIRSKTPMIRNRSDLLNACETGKYLPLIWCRCIPLRDRIDGYHRVCELGCLELVRYLIPTPRLISYGGWYVPDELEGMYNTSLHLAARKNNVDVVMFIDATSIKYDVKLNYDIGLYGACEADSLMLTNYMISKGAKDWNMGLLGACSANSLPLIESMVEKGAISLGLGLSIAKNQEVIDYLKFKLESPRPYLRLFYH